MTVKQYEAETMPDVLRLVRQDLGEKAVILQTRRVRPGLMGRLGRREQVQVLAGLETSVSVSPAAAPPARGSVPGLGEPEIGMRGKRFEPVASLHRALWMQRLSESGMESGMAAAVVAECGHAVTETEVAAAIERRVVVPSRTTAEGCRRIALVGPTGVGKTTTAAKLAARYALTEKKQVALITIDTYRISAVEQLRTYARVMGLPMEVAQTPEEMRAAVNRHADKDAILIDTVGRSPRQSLQLAEIRSYLNAAEPAETHLVLSATSALPYLAKAADQFAALGTDRLIVTKLDEMPAWGILPELIERTDLPLSYLTDGQDVPRHLRPADPSEVALHILGGTA